MKNVFFLLLFSLSISPVFGQDAIEEHFEEYMDREDFSTLYISPAMFSLVSGLNIDEMDQDIKDMISKLKGLRVLKTEKNGMKYYKEALVKIRTTSFEQLMEVREEKEKVKFFVKNKDDYIEELLLLVGSPNNFTLLSFVGEISLDQLSKLANKMNFSGSEHLDKLKDRDKK